MARPQSRSRITKTAHDVRKEDTKAFVLNAVEGAPDDVFQGSYWTGASKDGVTGPAILEPVYKPGQLYTLCVQNNILAQCVEAMEVNVDGTGHSIDLIEDEAEDKAEKQLLEDFFKEPYPGKSMIAVRRATRRDLESTGCGYMEVIRNLGDEVTLLNHLDSVNMRLIRYDEAVQVKRPIRRAGKDITVSMYARERRFVQDINGSKVYYKQFGSERDLDRETGKWAEAGTRLPPEKRATEVIYFTGNVEPKTPYGTPRWINQMPSVLGSRKAEEHNLEFFDAGGLPPVLIMIQGGTIGDGVRDELIAHLNGKGNKHRAAIVEAISTSGSLDSAGTVQMRVERFGADQTKDAMFQNYDKAAEEHVRVSFRLPPLFIGKAGDYSFATAYASYLVAEAQVFWPEREEFDDIINHTIVKALGAKKYRFRSLPLTMVDIANQLKALELVDGKYIDGEQFVEKLNELVGLGLEFEEQKEEKPQGKIDPLTGLPYTQPVPPQPAALPDPKKQTGTNNVRAIKEDIDLDMLANDWLYVIGAEHPQVELTTEDIHRITKQVTSLDSEYMSKFNALVSAKTFERIGLDSPGLSELCGCATHLAVKNDDQG